MLQDHNNNNWLQSCLHSGQLILFSPHDETSLLERLSDDCFMVSVALSLTSR